MPAIAGFEAPVLGNCVDVGKGGIVAGWIPAVDLLGGGACDATEGRLSVNQDGGLDGSAGVAFVCPVGSSPEAVTTA